LTLSAYGVIISHNHPSGNLNPSEADMEITREIKSMLEQFNINLVDHIIVTTGGGYSFEDEGIL
jgi:DNA repair protein RadC